MHRPHPSTQRPLQWRNPFPLLDLRHERELQIVGSVSADQRSGFRITEDVMMACIVLPTSADLSLPIQTLFEPADGYELESRLEELDQGYRECHARLARLDATAAEATDWLAAKLDALKDALLAQRRATGNGLRRARVSLAVTGIGFEHPTHLAQGQPIAVHVIALEGNHESFMAYAKVRQCRPETDALWVGAEFEPLPADHQRRLSRHILQTQIKQRKQ